MTTASLPEVVRHEMVSPAGGSLSAPSPMIEPAGLAKALIRRLLPALGLGVILAAIAAGTTYYVVPPAKYTSRAMLHVATEQPRILVKVNDQAADFATYQRTQIAWLKSRLVLGGALSQPDVAQLPVVRKQVDAIEWLEKEVQIDFANGSEILRIGMSGTDAREPAIVVNALVKVYLDLIVNVETKRRRDRADMLKETWNRYQENLHGKREELKRLSAQAGSNNAEALAILQRSEVERLGDAESFLAKTRNEVRVLRVELEVLMERESVETVHNDVALEDSMDRDPEVVRLTNAVQQAKAKLDAIAKLARKASDPAIQTQRELYDRSRKVLNEYRAALAPIVVEQHRNRPHGAESKLDALREKIEILTGLEQLQAGDVERLTNRSQKTTQASTDLAALKEEIMHAEDMAKRMGAEVEALSLELQAPPRIVLREPAEIPKTKDEFRQAKMAGMAGIGAFAFALFGVAFLEYQTRRIGSPDDVVRNLGLTLIGTLPARPRSLGRLARTERGWEEIMVSSVDAARTALLHLARDGSTRVVMITSAVGGEGKTSLSAHLSASLARTGRRTLLVDCDLRRPSICSLFELPGEPGVCEILRGEVEIESAVIPNVATDLSVLPAGLCDSRSLQALAREPIARLFARLRAEYDFVIVDTSPVLPVPDGLHIAQQADAVLYSVLKDVSRLPLLNSAHERLMAIGIRPLGVIVAGTTARCYGNDYYNYIASQCDPS